jgi:hypothetical protein
VPPPKKWKKVREAGDSFPESGGEREDAARETESRFAGRERRLVMKRTLAMLAGFSVIATASLAFAYPMTSAAELPRIRGDASIVAQRAENMLQQGRFRWRHRRFNAQGLDLGAIQRLDQSAKQLLRHRGSKHLFAEYQNIEARFQDVQRTFSSPSALMRADMNEIARAVSDMGFAFQQLSPPAPAPAVSYVLPPAPYAPPAAPAPAVSYVLPPAPYAPPAAPAPVVQPTTVYTTPGVSVSWY